MRVLVDGAADLEGALEDGETGAHEAFKDDLRLDQAGMSLRDVKSFQEGGYERFIQEQGEALTAASEDALRDAAPAQRVFDDAFQQYRLAGRTIDAARSYAAVMAARYQTRGAQLGIDAWDAYQRSGIRIVQDLPESLRRVGVDQLDVLLEALRKGGKGLSDRQLFGPSLLEFIARRGGIVDTGGELAAMDADKWHRGKPGRRKLVRPEAVAGGEALPMGMTPQAVQLAGAPSLPLLYQQGEARKTLLEKHAGTIDEGTLRRLPDLIADPIMIVKQENGCYGVLIADGRGQDVLVVIAPAADVGRQRMNVVVTTHVRARPDSLLRDVAAGRVTYRHQERSLAWLGKARRQNAGEASQGGFTGNIATEADTVKPEAPPPAKPRGEYDQTQRGKVAFGDGEAIITLFRDADLSTALLAMR